MINVYLSRQKYNFISWAIRKVTNSLVSHTIIHPENWLIVLHATGSGFHASYAPKIINHSDIVYSFKFLFDAMDELKSLLPKLEAKYDFGAIFGFLLFLILKAFGVKTKNWFAKKNALYCSEVLFVLLEKCVESGKLPYMLLKGHTRELFSPEDAYIVMESNPAYFERTTKSV